LWSRDSGEGLLPIDGVIPSLWDFTFRRVIGAAGKGHMPDAALPEKCLAVTSHLINA